MEVPHHVVEGLFVVTLQRQLVLQVLEDAIKEVRYLVGDCGVHTQHLVLHYI